MWWKKNGARLYCILYKYSKRNIIPVVSVLFRFSVHSSLCSCLFIFRVILNWNWKLYWIYYFIFDVSRRRRRRRRLCRIFLNMEFWHVEFHCWNFNAKNEISQCARRMNVSLDVITQRRYDECMGMTDGMRSDHSLTIRVKMKNSCQNVRQFLRAYSHTYTGAKQARHK